MSGALESAAPLALLAFALAGSAHCAAMCGPILWSATRRAPRADFIRYQSGRLAGYLCLAAALAELLRGVVIWGGAVAQGILVIFWGTGLIALGLALALNRPLSLTLLPKRFGLGQARALAAGFFSAFLPCGWLHAFLLSWLGLASDRARFYGGVVLFWAATLPVFAGVIWVASRPQGALRSFPALARAFGSLVLIGSGVALLVTRLPQLDQQAPSSSPPHWICGSLSP